MQGATSMREVEWTHKHYDNESFWLGDKVQGSPSIKLVLSEQKAYFYKGGRLAGVALISTGSEGHPTATGSFHIQELDRDHKSSEYGNYLDANDKIIQSDVDTTKDPLPGGVHFEEPGMPFFMRFNGGAGMHEGFMPGMRTPMVAPHAGLDRGGVLQCGGDWHAGDGGEVRTEVKTEK